MTGAKQTKYWKRDWQRRKQRRELARQGAYHLLLLVGAAFFAAPYIWLVMTSLKPEDQIFTLRCSPLSRQNFGWYKL